MTASRIYATPKPTQGGMAGAKIVPMSDHDRRWSHRNVARLGKSTKGVN